MTNIGNMYGPNFTFLGIPACDLDKPDTYKGRVGETFSKVRFAGTRLDLVNANFGSLSWVIFQMANFSCLTFACWASYTGALDITAGDVVMLSAYFTSIVNAIIALTSLGAVITKGLQSVRSLGEILESPDLEMNEGKADVSKVSG